MELIVRHLLRKTETVYIFPTCGDLSIEDKSDDLSVIIISCGDRSHYSVGSLNSRINRVDWLFKNESIDNNFFRQGYARPEPLGIIDIKLTPDEKHLGFITVKRKGAGFGCSIEKRTFLMGIYDKRLNELSKAEEPTPCN